MAAETEVERLLVRLTGDNTDYAQTLEKAIQATEKYQRDVTGRLRDLKGRFVGEHRAMSEGLSIYQGYLARGKAITQMAMTQTEHYKREIAELGKMLKLGAISQDVYNKTLAQYNQALLAAQIAESKTINNLRTMGMMLQRTGMLWSIFITAPLVLAGRAMMQNTSNVQDMIVTYTTFLGSAEKAAALVEQLREFAVATPLRMPEIQQAAGSLLAFGTSTEKLIPTLKALGDLSAGIGAPLNEIATIYGKARVQGRLFMEDINQLTGRGIPIIQELAAQFHVPESAIRGLVEKGKIHFKNLEQAVMDMTSKGGRFADLMVERSKTLSGRMSTLQDNIAMLGTTIGQQLLPVWESMLGYAEKIVGWISGWSDGTKKAAFYALAFIAVLGPIQMLAGRAANAIATMASWAVTLGINLKGATTAVIAFAGGIGTLVLIAGAALVAVIAKDISMWKQAQEARKKAIDLEKQAAGLEARVRARQKEQAASEAAKKKAEELAAAEERAAEAIKHKAEVWEEWASRQPWHGMQDDIDNLTKRWKEQIDTYGMADRESQLFLLRQRGATDFNLRKLEEYNKLLDDRERREKDAERAQEQQERQRDRATAIYEQYMTPLEKYRDTVAELKRLQEGGFMDEETFGRAMRGAREAMNQATQGTQVQLQEAAAAGSAEARARQLAYEARITAGEEARTKEEEYLSETATACRRLVALEEDKNRQIPFEQLLEASLTQ